jgi:hybrid cluster-associated redox disulfide protein
MEQPLWKPGATNRRSVRPARDEGIMVRTEKPMAKDLGEMIITDVLERWPETAEVFHAHGMACVGCILAPFYTLNDAAQVYSLDATQFMQEMLAAIH